MRRVLLAGIGLLLLAGCAASGRTAVVVATSDGAERYVGERSRGARGDAVALTAGSGTRCAAELQPTEEAATGRPAAYGGVRCDDGRIGMLLFSGAPTDAGGPVSGVMDRRPVAGGWGVAAGVGAARAGAARAGA